MRKFGILALLVALGACSKHDPILPGARTSVFDSDAPVVLNEKIEHLPDAATKNENSNCPYTRDASNVIWNGDKKIFSGFPTNNSVKSTHNPVCDAAGGFVYSGLTTGEVVKVNPKTRQIVWIADIYKPSNMTGGTSVLDIVAPVVLDKKSVYAGGLGDAFCRLDMQSGRKTWCTEISVAAPFVIAGPAAFVPASDNYLYAVRLRDGAIFWRSEISKTAAAEYANGIVTVGRDKFDAKSGKKTK